jgi:radical SAM-linked protein
MRIRVTFSKTGALRYIGHLDLHTIWERGARRAGLPLAYSQGFHPQPKINIASALPLGFASRYELVDLRLNEDIDLAELPTRLQKAMPSGISILKVESVDESLPALQTQVIAAEYEVTLTGSIDESELKRKIDELLASKSLPRERRGRKYDLRPLIQSIELTPAPLQLPPNATPSGLRPPPPNPADLGEEKLIIMRLSAREGATGRPDEVLDALGIPLEHAQIERTALIFQ